MAYTVTRKQTAFRLPSDLLARVKRRAQQENKSLNALVEEILSQSVQRELPGLPKDYATTAADLFNYKGQVPSPTREMLRKDPKLDHIWSKGV